MPSVEALRAAAAFNEATCRMPSGGAARVKDRRATCTRSIPAPRGTTPEAQFPLPRTADDVEVHRVLRKAGALAFEALEHERL